MTYRLRYIATFHGMSEVPRHRGAGLNPEYRLPEYLTDSLPIASFVLGVIGRKTRTARTAPLLCPASVTQPEPLTESGLCHRVNHLIN